MQETRETEVGFYPKHIEFGGKLIFFDTFYASTCRGLTKIISIALCFSAIVLVCASQPVHDERGPALFFAFLAIVGSFAILLEYTFMLNTKITTTFAFIFEAVFYVTVAVGLFVSAIFMIIFCANHWADMNPEWATMPSLAAGALLLCSALYVAEICILVSDARRCSWRPSNSRPVTTVLPE
ncbi:unnamed protein product [Caenorhabditis bovis]|uniref:MARVEL domain-containing protein n=1 Tax=Caenorhabditis bovis TaxID=2654633 RepID=A0A8S1FC71_9PELO|nr:unnamed protein product [Caenorhabditis bovis]